MKLVVNNPDAGKRTPPEAVTTPPVALISALKQAAKWRRVIVIAEDAEGFLQVNWSTMSHTEGIDMMTSGARLLGMGMRDGV